MSIREFQKTAPSIADSAYIDPDACVIGDVHVGADSSFWPMAIARGDVHSIRIGKRTNIQDGAVLHVTSNTPFTPGGSPLLIGNDVTIGHGAILHACTIENFCLIGMGATVLDGATIPDKTMVAAGALVPPGKILESGYLWVGSPAKKARPLSSKEMDYLSFSATHYVELKNKYIK